VEPNLGLATPATPKQRFGLIRPRIGADIEHRVGVDIRIEPPKNSTVGYDLNSSGHGVATRTRLSHKKSHHAYEMRDGKPFPTKVLQGGKAYLNVQDLSLLDDELQPNVRWVCTHPQTANRRFASEKEMFSAFDDIDDLNEECERERRWYFHYAVVEIAEVPEQKDEKTGKVTRPLQPATMLVLSNEV
jgi:hypothetical protein